jgi:putative hemolysin
MPALEVAILLVLIFLNGVFAMAELAMMTARRARVESRSESGSSGAKAALALKERPDRFLSAVQIGITLIGILSGAFAGATLAEALGKELDKIPMLTGSGEGIAVAAVVIVVTFMSLIFGELVPKQIALNNPEGVAVLISRPMRLLAKVSTPFVWLLSATSNGVMKALRIEPGEGSQVSEEEVRYLLREGTEAGLFEPAEQAIIERTFRLGDRSVRSLMTHRNDIVWLDLEHPLDDSMARMLEAPHHYFPLCRGDVHEVVGILAVKDVLQSLRSEGEVLLEPLAQKALFVIGSITGLRLLEIFRESRSSIALVVDEHGSLEGLVTVNDLLEAVVGGLPSVNEEEEIVLREDGSWLVEAVTSIENFEDHFQFDVRGEAAAGYFTTVAGLVVAVCGRTPSLGMTCQVGPFRFEVVDLDENRIDKILVTRLPESAD